MSDTPAHQFRFIAAPDHLSPFLNSLYELRVGANGLAERLPAYSAQLLLVAKGTGSMDFGNGAEIPPAEVFFIGPLSHAAQFIIDEAAIVLGVSFNFHGWAAISREPVVESCDRFLRVESVLGPGAAKEIASIASAVGEGVFSSEAGLRRLGDVIEKSVEPLPPGQAEVIAKTYAWLSSSFNPELPDLFEALSLSDRQTQRLVKKFFGLPPARLKRRFRAIRAAGLLADPDLDPHARNEVYDAFYDQAHMIREIRTFTGRTPKLLAGEGGSVISEMLGPEGYGVSELFGRSEEQQQLAKRN